MVHRYELINVWRKDGFVLKVWDTGNRDEYVRDAVECLMEALDGKDRAEASSSWFLLSPARLRMAETERTLDPDERTDYAAELLLSAGIGSWTVGRLLGTLPRPDAVHFVAHSAKWLEEQKGK